MSEPAPDLADFLDWEEGLPRPRWEDLTERLGPDSAPEESADLWTSLARNWLATLAGALGPDYVCDESENFLVLVPRPEPAPESLLRIAEQAREVVLDFLPGVAEYQAPGKQVVVVLRDTDTYYSYLSHFYPDGEYGGSGGVHLRQGYPHVALFGRRVDMVEGPLAHELTHAALVHLSLPQWVEEGLAQMAETRAGGPHALQLDGKDARSHQRFWAHHGLDLFWYGEGFEKKGKAQRLSYQLAEVLIRLLVADHRPGWFGLGRAKQQRLCAFLRNAAARDAGAAAARAHLGFGVEDLAARFLGPGEWAPAPSAPVPEDGPADPPRAPLFP